MKESDLELSSVRGDARIRTLVVDDEELAREKVVRLLKSETDIEVIAECGSGTEAVECIAKLTPDLVFLDIQIPELNGFEVVQRLAPSDLPLIIFVTAYNEYAIEAFEVNALDYILKPFDGERFRATLNRARRQVKSARPESIDQRLLSLLSDLRAEKQYPERLVLKTSGRVYFVKTSEIDWIEAAGNYVKLHVGESRHMLRGTMNKIEKRLPPDKFLRIHRSRLVNIDRIKELSPLFSGDYLVILNDNTELTLSRSYHSRLKEVIERFS